MGFQGKNASKFPDNPAKMFPRRSVAKFPANHAQKFQNKSASKYLSRSAGMCRSSPAPRSPKSPAKHFTSAQYAHNPPMVDSFRPHPTKSTIREPIWNSLRFWPTQPYEVLFIVLFITCLWNELQLLKNV